MFFTIFSSDFLHFNNWSYAQHLEKKNLTEIVPSFYKFHTLIKQKLCKDSKKIHSF